MSSLGIPTEWLVPLVVGSVGLLWWWWSAKSKQPTVKSTYCLSKFGVNNRQQLVAKLSSDDSDEFVWKLVQSVKKNQPSPQMVEVLVENIVLVMPDHARISFVKKLIVEEVKYTETAATLFRSNALATKAMTKISQQVGPEYLEALLGEFVRSMIEKDEDMEVFPSKVSDPEAVEVNAQNVERAFATFFKNLLATIDSLPWQIRLMASELHKESVKRFPGSSQTVIGGFLLLRFICPAIVLPGNLHSIEKPPSGKVQRGLITIAKILQNISNQVKWDAKEVYMTRFNHLIDDYLPDWNKVLAFLSEDVIVPAGASRTAKPVTASEYLAIEKDLAFFSQ